SENTITQLALEEVSHIVKAPISIENVSLRLFRNFPNATVEFNGFTIGKEFENQDSANFEITDTLVRFRKLYVSVKTKPLLSNRIEINKIEIEGIKLNYFVDTAGITNFDFLIASDSTAIDSLEQEQIPIDTSKTVLNILLADLTIGDIELNYNDESLKAKARCFIPKIRVRGKVEDDDYRGSIKGSIELTDCAFDDTNLHLMQKTELGFNIDYKDGFAHINELELLTDGATIKSTGSVMLADSIGVDLAVTFKEFDIKELFKYAPAEITKEFGISEVNGILDIEAKIEGYVYDTLLLPSVNTKITLKNGTVITTEYPEIQKLNIDVAVQVDNPNDLSTVNANIKDLSFSINKSNFKISGKASDLDKIKYDLLVKSHININDFVSFIPDSTVEYITGIVALNMHTKGTLPEDIENSTDYFLSNTTLDLKIRNLNTALDSVNVIKNLGVDFYLMKGKNLSIRNLHLDLPEYALNLDPSSIAVQLIGDIDDLDNIKVNINSFNFITGNNSIVGYGKVKGLNKPDFELKTTIKIDIDEIKRFIPDSTAEQIAGKVELKIDTHGQVDLDSIDNYINPIVFEQTKIDLKVRDFDFEMFGDTLIKFNNMKFDMKMAQDTIKIDNFYAKLHGIDLKVNSTEIWNVYKAFILESKGVPLIIANTDISLSEVDYNKFAHLLKSDEDETEAETKAGNGDGTETETKTETVTGTEIKTETESNPKSQTETQSNIAKQTATDTIPTEESYIPPYIARGTFAINKVKYDNIILNDISTKFRIDDSLYIIDQFKFNAFGGSMTTSAVYDTRDTVSTVVMFKNSIDKMNLNQILVDADNFGQKDFTHENISGILTSLVDGRIVMQGDSILYDKIIVRGDLKLENGGIYNYEPIRELGKFTNLRELDNIVFRTLNSGVFVYKNNIYFPKTDIVSTATDISAFGMVSFGDDYQLHLNVHLSDVLAGKSNKLLKAQGKESDLFDGEDESSRKGLNLLALNRDGSKKYGFDNKRMQRIMTAEIRVQERGLSLIFHPKLVSYSTDLVRKEIKKSDKPKTEEPKTE
ncbi:MAG TPA: AsmA-like C-terminal region-containing protein, partial [Salinivirgaceae bacterium]|nr:AsmA-like C-terminal region-containing protein [Salinivirgaceae bacterium]